MSAETELHEKFLPVDAALKDVASFLDLPAGRVCYRARSIVVEYYHPTNAGIYKSLISDLTWLRETIGSDVAANEISVSFDPEAEWVGTFLLSF